MGVVKFTVPGPLLGYRRPKDKNANYDKYTAFKESVLFLALEANWATKAISVPEHPVFLSVHVNWKKGPRADWSNIFKAIEDSIFAQDRWVKPGNKQGVEWDTGKEEAIVIVES